MKPGSNAFFGLALQQAKTPEQQAKIVHNDLDVLCEVIARKFNGKGAVILLFQKNGLAEVVTGEFPEIEGKLPKLLRDLAAQLELAQQQTGN